MARRLIASVIAGVPAARAHHEGDPTEDLSVWLMLAAAVVVLVVWLAVGRIRRRRRR